MWTRFESDPAVTLSRARGRAGVARGATRERAASVSSRANRVLRAAARKPAPACPRVRLAGLGRGASAVEMARETSAPPPEGDGEGAEETEEARRARVRRRLEGSWREPETSSRPERAPSPSPAEETDFYAGDTSIGFAGATERLRDAWVRKKVNRTRLRAKASASAAPETCRGSDTLDPPDPATWYREFPRQQFAFEWGDARESEFREARRRGRDATKTKGVSPEVSPEVSQREKGRMRYFSLERHGDGRRAFVAASLEAFWAKYEALPADHRHHYELIRADTPCRLYYDLEFSTETNPEFDGVRAVDALARLTLERLASEHGVGIARRPATTDTLATDGSDGDGSSSRNKVDPFDPKDVVVVLKSTGSEEARKKFSRHLVFRLPGVAFASAAHCGEFVRRLHADMSSRRGSDPDCDAVFVRGENAAKDAPRDVSFVDLGVYTRNRAFRLYLSSKHGKKHRLLPTRRFFDAAARGATLPATLPCLETFKACLVSAPAELSVGADAGPVGASARERSRTRVSKKQTTRLLEYPGIGAEGPYGFGNRRDGGGSAVLSGYGLGPGVTDSKRFTFCASSASTSFAEKNLATCPVRRTAAFVCADFDAWSPAGCAGASVRAWSASPVLGLATLHMQGNRFCENAGRAHKSNNVSFAVDFREGAYFQRCHDPDCRGFRGCFRALPDALLAEAAAFLRLADADVRAETETEGEPKGNAKGSWSPPRLGSEDDDDAFLLAAADAEDAARPREAGWTRPRFADDADDEAFWNRAAALAE